MNKKPTKGQTYTTGFFNPRGKWIAYPQETALVLFFHERMLESYKLRAQFLMTAEIPDFIKATFYRAVCPK